ncbi:hypothetical protein BT67DRAFT_369158 [Trichocladium antarcticum]|uniref:Uncharacterized protein n=1 Tax=Trichocladium antarcticum TaxID=1450529 RepID=A0AAN6UTV3_9PEZI|nr:hypothetical protein BT67DRAFT_369158 [Trichocladium antarcticum]
MPSLTTSYTITEPHPTVPQNSYTHSGRGGLGNFFRAPATTSPSGVPTPLEPAPTSTSTSTSTSPTSSARPRAFYSGRGGAGNAHAAAERPVLSFDEEFARAETRDRAPVSYVGRGGAGNFYASAAKTAGDDGSSISRVSSAASTAGSGSSARSGFWGRVLSRTH